MLKHKDIIDKLTASQKIALLTDTKEALGDAVKEYNIPTIAVSELWGENVLDGRELLFPSAPSVAMSWNEGIIGNVARGLATLGKGQGHNLFVLPHAGASMSVYGKGLAEEPYLCGLSVGAMARALSQSGASYCLKEPFVSKNDLRMLDVKADDTTLFERITRPFLASRIAGNAEAVMLQIEEHKDSYEVASKRLFDSVTAGMEQIAKIEDGDTTTQALLSGKHLIGGSDLAISTALDNYNRIYASMEEGGATAQELESTVAIGAAISEETLDGALDRKIELASRCMRGFTYMNDGDIHGLAYMASKESIVLLKNNKGMLPLRKGERIGLVGDIIGANDESRYKGFVEKISGAMAKGGATLVGYERGYDLTRDVSPEYIDGACRLSATSGVTVAFVGFGATREERLSESGRLALPGNQIAMLTKLRAETKKLVVVVCAERLPEMSFDTLADAILLVPPQGMYTAQSVWDVLSGGYNPTGRLTHAGYYGIDTVVRQQQSRKRLGRQKIGPFIGNRYMDSEGEAVPYHFGFGLSFTTFIYSKLSVNGSTVQFTVANTGKVDGAEVAQIYVGLSGTDSVRPKRELKGATKVFLKAGEKKRVSVSLCELESFDPTTGQVSLLGGEYDIYVSTHLGGVVLQKKERYTGVAPTKQERKLSNYLQNVSNIVSEGYTMEAYCKPMKTKSNLLSFGIILLITTLFADAIYAISCLMLEMDFMYYLLYFSIINGACLFLSLLFIIIGAVVCAGRKKAKAKCERKATEEMNKSLEPTSVKELNQLFESEFDISLEPTEKKETLENTKDESAYTYMAVDMDIPTMCQELAAHFSEYGLNIAPVIARRILSAVMTSRLLVVRSVNGISCERIVEILSRFFVTEPHTDNLNGITWNRKSLLRYNEAEGGIARPAPLMQTLYSAMNDREKAYFCGIGNAKSADLGQMLMPYIQYFGNPDGEYFVNDESGLISLPQNIWVVLTLAKGQSIEDLPAFVANVATVVDIEAQGAPERANKSVRKYISVHQLDALVYRAKKACEVSEDIWKNVDRLEGFVNEKTPYHIGNKLFLQLEKYMAVYTACHGEMGEALDSAVAGKLLPGILNMLKGNETLQDTDLSQVVESIFGEENAQSCCNVIKRPVIDRGRTEAKVAGAAPVNSANAPANTQVNVSTNENGQVQGEVNDAK